jgi:hypothetical protein
MTRAEYGHTVNTAVTMMWLGWLTWAVGSGIPHIQKTIKVRNGAVYGGLGCEKSTPSIQMWRNSSQQLDLLGESTRGEEPTQCPVKAPEKTCCRIYNLLLATYNGTAKDAESSLKGGTIPLESIKVEHAFIKEEDISNARERNSKWTPASGKRNDPPPPHPISKPHLQ